MGDLHSQAISEPSGDHVRGHRTIPDVFGIFFAKRSQDRDRRTLEGSSPRCAGKQTVCHRGTTPVLSSPRLYFSLEDAADIRAISVHQIQVPHTRLLAIRDEEDLLTRRRPSSIQIIGGMLCQVHLFTEPSGFMM